MLKKQSRLLAKSTYAILLAAMLLPLQSLVMPLLTPEHTQGAAFAQKNSKKRSTPALRERVYKKIAEAEEFINTDKHQEATRVLEELLLDKGLNGYERAQAMSYQAYLYANQEKYSRAIEAYKGILKEREQIPLALELSSLYQMAQVYSIMEQYKSAIATMKEWFEITEEESPSAHELMSQLYHQTDDFKNAVKHGEQALSIVKKQGGKPKENLYLILRAGYYELNNQAKVAAILEELVGLYPKGEYFTHLSHTYGEMNQEAKQVAVLEAAYDASLLSKERELVALASLLLQNDVPYKAGTVLEIGMQKKQVEETVQNLKLLAQAWQVAQEAEKSIKVLTKAAEKDEEGELYVRLAQAYADIENWKMAIKSASNALDKGGLKNPGAAHVTQGLAYFHTDELDNAISAFSKARKYDNYKSYSDGMLRYLEKEKDRRQRLQHSLL